MSFFKFLRTNNKGGDVGMTGMLFVLVILTVMTMALDLFANMISKEYVIEKMQAAQSYTLISNYDDSDTESSSKGIMIFRDTFKMQNDYKNYLANYLDIGNTVFNDIKISTPNISQPHQGVGVIEGNVTYEPHQFIRNPSDALFKGVTVKNPSVTTKVRTMMTFYRTNDESSI